MKCKHENADHLMPGEWFTMQTDTGPQPMHVAQCEQFRCIDCGAWLTLGPSNDEDERVKVEIRAAMLAIDKDADETTWSPEEIGGGYVAACWEPGAPFSDVLDNDEQHAGYLGWIIEHHEEQP